MMKNSIYFLLVLLAMGSCKPKQNMIYMSADPQGEAISQAKFEGLRVQEGDVLLILVSALDDLAVRPFNLNTMNRTNSETASNSSTAPSEYLVNSDGNINFPVIGTVAATGLTKEELKNALESRLREYLTDPLVSIQLKNFSVNVLGEVKSPGQKESNTEKLNVFQALALAGDMTDYGDRTKVKLIRSQEGEADMVVNLNVSDSRIVQSPYYYLQQNDVLYVEPDSNKQVAANTNPNRNLWFQIGGAALSVISLIIGLTR